MTASTISDHYIAFIARICHNVNRIYCQSIGDNSQPTWEEAPAWQKDSAIAGVRAHLAKPMTPEESHQLWMDHKAAEGWVYGLVKDPVAKTHPCMVPYADLPKDQQVKDQLFQAIVKSFTSSN